MNPAGPPRIKRGLATASVGYHARP